MEPKAKTPPNGKTRVDVLALMNDRLIELLEKGIVPWRQTWKEGGVPRNLVSKHPYRGINLLLLTSLGYAENVFVSFNQLKEIGGKVKDDKKSCPVMFWKFPPKEEAPINKKPTLHYYSLFNISQCEDIPESYLSPSQAIIGSVEACEHMVSSMPQCPNLQHKVNKTFYDPLYDFINMPKKNTFATEEAYYMKLFHQLIHATGHHSRLGRKDLIEMPEFGYNAFSHEELVAEIGAGYLQSFTGVSEEIPPSQEYISGWLKRFKDDKQLAYSAAGKAQQAVDFILNVKIEEEKGQ
ncbi:MAG: DUF1738 domain-containing protein [Bacteroidetes bacterium]|nr:DUF1738 domain-containing protein [Bacteroidota bacterium]